MVRNTKIQGAVICLLLMAILLAGSRGVAYGSGFKDNSSFLQGYLSTENQLWAFFAGMEKEIPSAGQFQVMLGDKETHFCAFRKEITPCKIFFIAPFALVAHDFV